MNNSNEVSKRTFVPKTIGESLQKVNQKFSNKFGKIDYVIHVNWKQIVGIGFLGGIGFTMSIFLSGLAFESYDLISTSKMAIFSASLLAGIVGFLILKLTKTN